MKFRRFLPFVSIMTVLCVFLTITAACNLLGDMDNDGRVTTADARRVLRYAAGLETASAEILKKADVNNDGKLTVLDARIVLRVSLGLQSFPGKDEIAINADSAAYTVEVNAMVGQNDSVGSGFFISENGTCVTNYHVIKGASYISVKDKDNNVFNISQILAYDAKLDIAVMQADFCKSTAAVLNYTTPIIDSKCFALGSPDRESFTFSSGKIIGLNKLLPESPYTNFILSSVPTSYGSSGGPLIDAFGQVIGITSRIANKDNEYNTYALPLSYLNKLDYFPTPLSIAGFAAKTYHTTGLYIDKSTVALGAGENAVITLTLTGLPDSSLDFTCGEGIECAFDSWYQDGTMIDLNITNLGITDKDTYVSITVDTAPTESAYIVVKLY
ncbi:MAG TPA: trypsin-like serine protease [Clostridiales bacterium]|nr:trypsin-like serine protease [Clostridiales bacterium]